MNRQEELHRATRRYRYDPHGFVVRAFPWKRGAYRQWEKPWPWHKELFDSIGLEAYSKGFGPDASGKVTRCEPILRSVASGTGTGKSSLVLPGLLFWSLSVFPQLRGVAVSASKENLTDKFFKDCLALMQASEFLSRYFDSTSDGTIWVRGARHTRSFIFRTSGKVEALSGLHSMSGCTCVLFEESGGIDDESFLATDGARSDPQVIACAVGQPTRLDWWFHRVTYGDLADLWNMRRVSLFDMPNATQELRKRKVKEHGGAHTDDFRVFCEGLPRQEHANSFIARAIVEEAMSRSWVDPHGRPVVDSREPLIAGLDLARGGSEGAASNVMAFRAGLDGRINVVEIAGEKLEPRDRADWAIQEATKQRLPYGKPVVCVYDETGLDGLFRHAIEERKAGDLFVGVNFGMRSPSPHWVNIRAAMWGKFSEWLFAGGMLPDDEALKRLILAARSEYDRHGKVLISPKKQMGDAAGRSRMDELDARLLTLHEPAAIPQYLMKRMARPAAPVPGEFSLMG